MITKNHFLKHLENIKCFTTRKIDFQDILESQKIQKEKSTLVKGLNKCIIDRKEKIKFIVFHNRFINVLSNNYKLKVNFTDVEEIVKLRNDISHFNDYKITQNDLEKYIDYLELLVNYVHLRLVGYSDENFINNLRFYPYKHRVFDFENN